MSAHSDITVLNITSIGVPPYSARGLTQTLTPIQAGYSQRRTVNGTLVNLAATEYRKYRSVITGNDQQPPPYDNFWIGQQIVVDCIAELAYTTGQAGSPARTVVSGSSRTESGFTFYRPRLTMLVVNWSIAKDEYGAVTGWSLDSEEV